MSWVQIFIGSGMLLHYPHTIFQGSSFVGNTLKCKYHLSLPFSYRSGMPFFSFLILASPFPLFLHLFFPAYPYPSLCPIISSLIPTPNKHSIQEMLILGKLKNICFCGKRIGSGILLLFFMV